MTTEFQREQQERRDDLRRSLREGTTLHQFQQSEANIDQGRYTANERSTVVGATDAPVYPKGPDWTAGDPVPTEPALGYSVEDHEPVGTPAEVQASIDKVSPLAPSSPTAQGNCGGADEAPTLGSASLTDVVEPSAPPTSIDDDDPPRAA